MRFAMILAAGGALVLTACGGKNADETVANADSSLTADHIAANDVTAIDAVTGEDANMAADVEFNSDFGNADSNADSNVSEPSKPTAKPSAKKTRAAPWPAANSAAEEPATNAE